MGEALSLWNGETTTLRNKSVMITGSTGFIGSRLAATVPEGFEVYLPSRFRLENPEHLQTADFIIHAAGYAAPSLFMQNPISTIKVNTETTIHLLERLNPGGSFLFCSSSEVYKGLLRWASEDDIGVTTPYHPRASYIEGKKCGETIINAYRNKGVRAMSARIGLTYGPGTRKSDARVMNQIIEQALTKSKIELIDDGSATIPLCYIDDMAKMLWTALLKGTQAVYNVGSPNTMSIANLARKIGAALNVSADIPTAPVGAPHAKMDLTRFCSEFGPPDYTPWEEGLSATIDYQKRLYGVV